MITFKEFHPSPLSKVEFLLIEEILQVPIVVKVTEGDFIKIVLANLKSNDGSYEL